MSTTQSNKGFAQRLLIALARILVILLVVGVLCLAGFYLVLSLYPRAVAPIQANSAEIAGLSTAQVQDRQLLNQRIDDLQARIVALETQHTQDTQTLADLDTRLGQAEQALSDEAQTLGRLDDLQSSLDALQADLDANQQAIQTLDQQISDPGGTLGEIQRQVQMLRLMNLLADSRMALAQNNPGLATQNLQVMRDLLAQLGDLALDSQQGAVTRLTDRLELALASLPDYPVLAEKDLEILWEELLLGLPGDPGSLDSLVSPSVLLYGQATPDTATPTLTPTPPASSTVTSSPTPTSTPTP